MKSLLVDDAVLHRSILSFIGDPSSDALHGLLLQHESHAPYPRLNDNDGLIETRTDLGGTRGRHAAWPQEFGQAHGAQKDRKPSHRGLDAAFGDTIAPVGSSAVGDSTG